jgi:hypothetical protein
MADSSIILYLIIATFGAVLVYAAVQFFKVRKAKETGKRSAMGDGPRRQMPREEPPAATTPIRDLPRHDAARPDAARRDTVPHDMPAVSADPPRR